MSGEHLTDSQVAYNQGQPVVTTVFDSLGARMFAKLTGENIGKRFAVVLDNQVIVAPVIRSEIPTGSGQIEGNFTAETANDLAMLLRSGALPAPLTILEERTVGAGLGADSIAAGKFASILGLAFVAVFMLLAYNLFGGFCKSCSCDKCFPSFRCFKFTGGNSYSSRYCRYYFNHGYGCGCQCAYF